MGKVRSSRLLAGLVAAVVIVAGGAVAASADQVVADGDMVTPLTNREVLSLTMCVGQEKSAEVLIAVRRNGNGQSGNGQSGNGNQIFASGSTVALGLQSAPTGFDVELDAGEIVLDAGWANQIGGSTDRFSDTVTATVTVPAQQIDGNGTIFFRYEGKDIENDDFSGTTQLSVSWTVAGCDGTPPVLTLPTDVVAEPTSQAGAAVSFTATATDAAPVDPAVTCVPASGTVFPFGTTTVECTSTDAAGNVATGSFPVTVQDKTAPVVSKPTGLEVEAEGLTTTVTWVAPTASDTVDGALATTCSPASGSAFALGVTAVTCSATDAHGNTGSAGFSVEITDTKAPVLVVPTNLTAEATSAGGAFVTFEAKASDAVDGDVAVTCDPASGSQFGFGPTTVTCKAVDARGNKADGQFVVTVADTTAPTLSVEAPEPIEATGPLGARAAFTVTADDVVDGDVPVVCSATSGSAFEIGTTTVECTATDAHGNTGTAKFDVTVQDTTAPALKVAHDRIVLEATGPDGAVVADYGVTAVDLVDGSVPVTCTPEAGAVFALGVHAVECEAKDTRGNVSSSKAVAIEVVDTTAPAITWGETLADGAEFVFGTTVPDVTCTAYDIVDEVVPCSVEPFNTVVGTHTLTATATDLAGNVGTATRDYSVKAWRLGGFYAPVDMAGVWNTVKGGSTVPLKFELFAGATELTSINAVKSFKYGVVACGSADAATDELEVLSTGGTSLRYDTTGGQFIQNWQTPKAAAGSCYKVTMTTQDGSSITALFKLK